MSYVKIVRMIDPSVLERRMKASRTIKALQDARTLEARRLAAQLEKR